jgi:peptidase C39-like protein/WD40 repeat protein
MKYKYILPILFLSLLVPALYSTDFELPGAMPVYISRDASLLLLTTKTCDGLWLLHTDTGIKDIINTETSSGYYPSISPDNRFVCYKTFRKGEKAPLQIPTIYDIKEKKIIPLNKASTVAGTPAISSDGRIAFSVNNQLIIRNPKTGKDDKINLGYHVNLISFSIDGKKIAFTSSSGGIDILTTETKKTNTVTSGETEYWGPQFSPSGKYILLNTPYRDVECIDTEKKTVTPVTKNKQAGWSDSDTIIFCKRKTGGKTEIVRMSPSGELLKSTILESGHKRSVINGNGVVLKLSGEIRCGLFGKEKTQDLKIFDDEEIVEPNRKFYFNQGKAEINSRMKNLEEISGVPVINQLYDTANDFNGHAACGAAAAIMAIQYYKILPVHPMSCKGPYEHNSDFGWYISHTYSFNGTNYDISANTPSKKKAYGGYGYVCQDTGWFGGEKHGSRHTSTWLNQYIKNHGLESTINRKPGWEALKSEINEEHPFILLTGLTLAGHYKTVVGYIKNQHTAIFNEPYGNKNSPKYPGNTSCRVFYDWPGYNNGYSNMNRIHCIITCIKRKNKNPVSR